MCSLACKSELSLMSLYRHSKAMISDEIHFWKFVFSLIDVQIVSPLKGNKQNAVKHYFPTNNLLKLVLLCCRQQLIFIEHSEIIQTIFPKVQWQYIDFSKSQHKIWLIPISIHQLHLHKICLRPMVGKKAVKNIVYHFPNKINRNMLRVSLTEKMLTKRLTRVAIPNPDLHP